ncbi:hypothetical protein [Frigidibacter sp. SD6-1]|uniref:hypothetical protein n=1 Tax=Frigidibacter sp. SD6-1 TaxID=3032581 RepID=UPI0024E00B6F|nr:hypothetical protein [Frigidibacter sp. SD6-1]
MPAARLQGIVVWTAAIVALCPVLWGLWDDWRIGGDSWQQGDWLISGLGVRRGPLGSLFLLLSDLTGASPLLLVVLAQGLLAATLFLLTARAFATADAHYLLIFFSPAFFLLAWTADPLFGLRKELLGFLALALAGRHPRLAAALYVVAIVAHEANLFLAPAMWLLWRTHRPLPAAATAAVLLVTASAMLFALIRSSADPVALCRPLLDRGLDPVICGGIIAKMDTGAATWSEIARAMAVQPNGIAFLALAFTVQMVLLALCLRHRRGLREALILIGLWIAMLPLFIVAVDWGRWLSMQVTSFGFVMLARARSGEARVERNLPAGVLALICAAGLLVAPIHYPAIRIGGTADRLRGLLAGTETLQDTTITQFGPVLSTMPPSNAP